MSDDWQVGDLALCVSDKNWTPNGYMERAPDQCSGIISMLFPRVGSEWRVTIVSLYSSPEEQANLVYLGLAGQTSDYLYDARYFRKIQAHQADEFDRETIALLNRQPETLDNPRASLADRHGAGAGLCGFVHNEPNTLGEAQDHV